MNRYKEIDLLKAVAIFGVIVIHTCSAGFSYPVASVNWSFTLFWGAVARASVPIFFMCSGVLFLSPAKELPFKKLFLKYICRIIAALFFWSFLYKLYHLCVMGTLSVEAVLEALKQILVFDHEFHFYYLHIIILFYALLPIVRIFVKYASKKELQYGLILWFLVGILYPTVKPFWPFSLLGGIPGQWALNMTYASVGYGLLGYYLKEYGLSVRASVLSSVFGLLIVFGGTYVMSVHQGATYSGFLEGMSVGTAMLAAGIFGLCLHAGRHLSNTLSAVVTYVSKASFCIYSVHVLMMYLLSHFGLNALMLSPVVSIPAVSALNLALSCAVYAVLSRIPVVKKWLV